MSTAVRIDHAKALDAIGHADWYLAQAYLMLVKPCCAAIELEGAEPDALMEGLLAVIRDTQRLSDRFTEAQAAT